MYVMTIIIIIIICVCLFIWLPRNSPNNALTETYSCGDTNREANLNVCQCILLVLRYIFCWMYLMMPKQRGWMRSQVSGCCGDVLAHITLQHQGQSIWADRPGWWSLFLRRGTGGCVPTTAGSNFFVSLGKSMPRLWRGEFGR